MFNLEDLITLLGANKVSEAIEYFEPHKGFYSSGVKSNLMQIAASFAQLKNRKDANTITDSEYNSQEASIRERLLNIGRQIFISTDNSCFNTISIDSVVQKYYSFVDRKGFRQQLSEILNGEKAHIIFVRGMRESGMTYLENYLMHIESHNPCLSIQRIDAEEILEGPSGFHAVSIAKYICLGLGINIEFQNDEPEQFKFKRFTTELRKYSESFNKTLVIFIHDFHKVEVQDNTFRLFAKIADEFRQAYPKLVFIIAGIDYVKFPNWELELENYCLKYDMEGVSKSDVTDCLASIYQSHQQKINQLMGSSVSIDQYLDGMLPHVYPSADTPIKRIGSQLNLHLKELNKI